MAKRESQGLQIALILLVMVTVILCIATYFFWSQSQKNFQSAEAAKGRINTLEQEGLKAKQESATLKQFLGYAEDDAIETIEENRNQDMLLYGQGVVEGERNYRDLPQQLVKVIQERNQQINDLLAAESQLKQEKQASEETWKEKNETAEQGHSKAGQDLLARNNQFEADTTELKKRVDEIEKKANAARQRLTAERNDLKTKLDTALNDVATLKQRNNQLDEKLRQLQVKTFEQPDGKITFVNQSSRFVYIDLGRADALQRQTTFSVYDVDENNLARTEPKGSIEVTQLLGDHLAEARILEDSVIDPIISGDLIYSPIWQAGSPVHFALAGFLDVDRDGANDRDLVKNLISLNGGVVDAEVDNSGTRTGDLSIETRYLVIGKRPNLNTDAAGVREFERIRTEAETFGTTEIALDRFLADMGYQSVGRSVALGSQARTEDFRTERQKTGTGRFLPRKPPKRIVEPVEE